MTALPMDLYPEGAFLNANVSTVTLRLNDFETHPNISSAVTIQDSQNWGG